jgi:hypothetical protein
MKYLLIVITFLLSSCIDYSDGDRVGVITKFSRKGLLFKTWEGELNLGGLRKNADNNVVANTWKFTVENNVLVINQIEDALDSNKTVKLHYKQEFWSAPWRAETNYFIDSVKIK